MPHFQPAVRAACIVWTTQLHGGAFWNASKLSSTQGVRLLCGQPHAYRLFLDYIRPLEMLFGYLMRSTLPFRLT